MANSNPKVFFDIEIGSKPAGRIEMELFADVVPKTAKHFLDFCTGERVDTVSGKPFHYKGTFFHRVIPEFMCQGGDFVDGNGVVNRSFFQNGSFPPENFEKKHTGFGDLCMVVGRDTPTSEPFCGSQFYISTTKADWLDNDQVVFGKVVKGEGVIRKIEAVGDQWGRLRKPVQIVDCNQL